MRILKKATYAAVVLLVFFGLALSFSALESGKAHAQTNDCFTRQGYTIDNGAYDQQVADANLPNLYTFGNGDPSLGAFYPSCDGHIHAFWTTPSSHGFYQIRWGEGASENATFTTSSLNALLNVSSGIYYSLSVQGCDHVWFWTNCTSWSPTVKVSTRPFGDCKEGYVWREANSTDHICVTPQTRSQTAYDNSQAVYRVNPSGAYGPDTCIQGYVWREAFSGDHVCVTPQTRSQAAYDNSQQQARLAP